MAGRGPVRKDPERRVRAATHKPSTLEVVPSLPGSGVLGAPEPPAGLLEHTQEQWESFWGSPVARLVDRSSDMPALERLFELYDDCTRFRASIRANPMVDGSKGQLVRNPFVKDLKDTQAEVRQLEDRFGLSPRARLALNLTLGGVAKTLADLNADFAGGDGDDDPRADFHVIDGDFTGEATESTA